MVPTLHDGNKQDLERMLGVPIRMKSLPKELVERVLKCQKCMSRVSLSEQLPTHTLLSLCYDYEALPQIVPTKYGHVRDGETVYFKVNDYEWQPCTFIGVADPQMHTYHIHIWGENRTAPENMLRLQHPGDVPVESDVAPKPTAQAEPETPAPDEVEDTEAARTEKLKAQRVLDHAERLKEAWPKETLVDVALPGEAFFQGKVIAHGTGRWLGKLQVRPLAEKGASYRWVPGEYISAGTALPAAKEAVPV